LNVRIHRALERIRGAVSRDELITKNTDQLNNPLKEDS
jgi:hypothetical protein